MADPSHAVLSRARSGWDDHPECTRPHIQPLDNATLGEELEATAPARIFSAIAVVTHSMLATMMSKKILIRDPEAPNELKVYVVILSALLVVRIPLVRKLLKQIPVLLKRKPNLQVSPIAKPDGGAELWPKVHGRESGVSIKPSFIISNVKPAECNSMGSPPGKTNGFSGSYADDPSIKTPLEEEAEVQ